jgi:NAD(P)-dependent dehydrogenase (short-subunit alcohol dehydrogenase family)
MPQKINTLFLCKISADAIHNTSSYIECETQGFETNNSTSHTDTNNKLIVGGTNGIGAHLAYKMAENTSASKIIITGRNKEAGTQVVSELNKLTKHENNDYLPCDISLMKYIYQFTSDLKQRLDKLNYLVLCTGCFTPQREETEEGIDRKLACNFYSRFLLVKELLPLLNNATKQGESARVLSIMGAGSEGEIDPDDLEVKTNYGLMTVQGAANTYNSLMVEEFSNQYPAISFMHITPGFVDTPGVSKLPWYLYYPSRLYALFGTSQEDCGQIMTYVLTTEDYEGGWHLLSKTGDKIQASKYQTRENLKLVWDHAVKVTSI